jgi:hypothetical protein
VIGRGACIAVRVGLVESTALLCPLRAIVCVPEFAFEKVLAWYIFAHSCNRIFEHVSNSLGFTLDGASFIYRDGL